MVGKVIDIAENEDEVLVNIQEELEDQDEIEIEYYTERLILKKLFTMKTIK